MSNRLYELVNYKQELEGLYASDEIEQEAIETTLEGLGGEIAEKVAAIAQLVRNLEAQAEPVREAGKALLERAAVLERRIERIRAYTLWQLQRADIEGIESVPVKVKRRKAHPAVVIDDMTLIPMEYLQPPAPQEPVPQKNKIREALLKGKPVPGAHLLQTEWLYIGEK